MFINISNSVFETYLTYRDILEDMNAELETHHRSDYETELAEWLPWHVDEPCRILEIPTSTVETIIHRYAFHQTTRERYRGCTQSVLVTEGVHGLAEKLWVDRIIVLARLHLEPGIAKLVREYIAVYAINIFGRMNGVTCRSDCRNCDVAPPPADRGKALHAADPMCSKKLYVIERVRLPVARPQRALIRRVQSQCMKWLIGRRYRPS
ncbi:hypothetical protein LTR95_014214 [Oleoguttula sp. CCFEE 5521]